MKTFECRQCKTVNSFVRPAAMTTVRCSNCGDVYVVYPDGAYYRFNYISYLRPIDTPRGQVTPWHLPNERPVDVGWYECRFQQHEPAVLRLWWNGYRFTVNGSAISMRGFMSFRGASVL